MSTTAVAAPWTDVSTVRVRDQVIRVARRDGVGVPLLIFNGFGCSVEVVEPFVNALSRDTPVVTFDIPGVGESPLPRRPYRLSHMAALADRLMHELGYGAVHALGVSWGGALAQQFALQCPGTCRRLILVSTGALALVRPTPTVLRELVTNRRRDPVHGPSVAGQVYGGKLRDDPELVRLVQRGIPPTRKGSLYQQLALLGWTSLPVLRRIRQRTLVLTGDDDQLVPMLNARILLRALPRAELHVFHDGHMGMLTSADEVAPVVERFCARP